MLVTIPQSQLDAGVHVVVRAIAARAALPVTGHILLQTRPGKLKLAATNLDLAIITVIDADVAEEGSLAVPARTFADLVGSLPDGPIELRGGQTPDLAISAPGFTATAKGLNAAEFPAIEAADAEVCYAVPAQALRQAVEDVSFAAAKDQTQPQLSGVLLRAQGTRLTLVGCDRFRLSIRTIDLAAPVAEGCPDLIVPRATMLEAARGFGAMDAAVAVAATPTRGQVVLATSALQMISRVIDGAYLEYQRVLDQIDQHDVTITAAAADVQRAARFSQIVARGAANKVVIDAAAGGAGRVVLRATAAQVGENTTELTAIVDGPGVKLGLDNAYLVEALGAIRSDRLVIRARSEGVRPILLRPEPGGDALHLIMPLALDGKA